MYEMKRQVTYSQVGSDLKADIAMITYFFQDCALFHSESIGKGVDSLEAVKSAWFLSGWQIEVMRYPGYRENITVRTWPHEFKGLYGSRNFDILDEAGQRIVQANSIWIFMDLENMRPAKPAEQDIAGYDIKPALPMDYAPRKIKMLGEEYMTDGTLEPVSIKRSFIDSNRHVNNVKYVALAMDYIEEAAKIITLRVDYRKAAAMGDILYPRLLAADGLRQVIFENEGGQPYVIVELGIMEG
ncbi:MAG: thioesterase [Clostridium sp.]|nr:thioesterase [Clostridium sp.]